MGRPLVLALAATIAALATSAAEAKFKVSLVVQPAPPVARQQARVTMRTEIVLPEGQTMSLIAVGPWRKRSGQGVLEVRFVRIGPRAFRASLRFPYSGRWRMNLVTAAQAAPLPPIAREVRVRPAS